MASIIDNRNKTMLESLKNSLKQAERVDILTAFFYFSGFNALAEDLKDKKIRILVGNTIDPSAIAELCKVVKDDPDEALEAYSPRGYKSLNNSQRKITMLKVLLTCSINLPCQKNLILRRVKQFSKCSFQK